MNGNYVIVGAAGLAIGLAAGIALGWKFAVDSLEDQYQQDITDFILKYKPKETLDDFEKKPKEKKTKIAVTEVTTPTDEEEEQPDYILEAREGIVEEKPYIIQPNQYYYENLDYDKIAWFFYLNDKVMCDDSDSVVPEEDISTGTGQEFMEDLLNSSMVYIRNERLRSDYIITALQDSYSSDVEGRVETPKEREKRQKSRSKPTQKSKSRKQKPDESDKVE